MEITKQELLKAIELWEKENIFDKDELNILKNEIDENFNSFKELRLRIQKKIKSKNISLKTNDDKNNKYIDYCLFRRICGWFPVKVTPQAYEIRHILAFQSA